MVRLNDDWNNYSNLIPDNLDEYRWSRQFQDLYLCLRGINEGETCTSSGTDLRKKIFEIHSEINQEIIKTYAEALKDQYKDIYEQKIREAETSFNAEIVRLKNIITEVLKLYGASALVSPDQATRDSAEKLLKDNKINIYELLKEDPPA